MRTFQRTTRDHRSRSVPVERAEELAPEAERDGGVPDADAAIRRRFLFLDPRDLVVAEAVDYRRIGSSIGFLERVADEIARGNYSPRQAHRPVVALADRPGWQNGNSNLDSAHAESASTLSLRGQARVEAAGDPPAPPCCAP